jgi:hypothetical protein
MSTLVSASTPAAPTARAVEYFTTAFADRPALRLGTRTSPMALAQARLARDQLADLGVGVEIVPVETSGDLWQGDLADLGGKGQFMKKLDRHLLLGGCGLHRADRPQQEPPTKLGKHELAVLLSSVFLRGTGLDWYEQGDVWARVASLRNRPEPFRTDATLAQQVRTLMTINPQPLIKSGPLRDEAAWVHELSEAGQRLAGLNRRGLLTRGLRAVCAHYLIFSFNRWGLSHRDQHVLTTTAREVVMTDTRTPTAEAHTAARQRLVDALRDGGHIQSPAVEEAFRQVPRHVFVPPRAWRTPTPTRSSPSRTTRTAAR